MFEGWQLLHVVAATWVEDPEAQGSINLCSFPWLTTSTFCEPNIWQHAHAWHAWRVLLLIRLYKWDGAGAAT